MDLKKRISNILYPTKKEQRLNSKEAYHAVYQTHTLDIDDKKSQENLIKSLSYVHLSYDDFVRNEVGRNGGYDDNSYDVWKSWLLSYVGMRVTSDGKYVKASQLNIPDFMHGMSDEEMLAYLMLAYNISYSDFTSNQVGIKAGYGNNDWNTFKNYVLSYYLESTDSNYAVQKYMSYNGNIIKTINPYTL